MKNITALLLCISSSFAIASPINYQWNGSEPFISPFNVTTNDFITSDQTVLLGANDSCGNSQNVAVPCTGITFFIDAYDAELTRDDLGLSAISINYGFDGEASYFYFDANAFSTIGTHSAYRRVGLNLDVSIATSQTEERDEEFFRYKNQPSVLPQGELKIWDDENKEYVSLSSDRGEALFEPTKDTEVLVHGWNGDGNNTPLEQKWIVDGGFTEALAENIRIDSNILAFDWTEGANSRLKALDNMSAAELNISVDELNALLQAEIGVPLVPLPARYFYLTPLLGQAAPIRGKWNSILDDFWVPNQQVAPQAQALVSQLGSYLSQEDSGTVAFFGHSLGAGVSTHAVEQLIAVGLGNKVSRLTLFDPPEEGLADLVGGSVNLAERLKNIKQNSTRLPIDNFWSSTVGEGFGQAYSYASNIESFDLVHGATPVPFYLSTVNYNTDPNSLSTSGFVGGNLNIFAEFDTPTGIGYDDETGSLTLARQGTNCKVQSGSGLRGINPFADGLNNCIENGFSAVFDDEITKIKVDVDFKAFLGSTEATVSIDEVSGLPTLTTGSNVYAYTDFFVPSDAIGFEIDLEWLNGFMNDDFGIWINDTLVYNIDFENLLNFSYSTGIIGLERWKNQWVTLTFGVLSDFSGSSVKISDLRLVQTAQVVSEPPTIILMLLGSFLLFLIRLKSTDS
jgi:pimeloyl-ACP methyl ester carboxylesterase